MFNTQKGSIFILPESRPPVAGFSCINVAVCLARSSALIFQLSGLSICIFLFYVSIFFSPQYIFTNNNEYGGKCSLFFSLFSYSDIYRIYNIIYIGRFNFWWRLNSYLCVSVSDGLINSRLLRHFTIHEIRKMIKFKFFVVRSNCFVS